ncbi:molybdopterin-dependent oxidoreductase [Radicibacter daui]|uniref:molybdopterin-dependent oxidoreductase n=1 Tax=Radicibacter daui TaxID=3064829 RepID=UPI004046B3C2
MPAPLRDHRAPAGAELPPAQAAAAPGKWPVVGEKEPGPGPADWTLTLAGLAGGEKCWSLAELQARPQSTLLTDIHCVTRWSMVDQRFTGIFLADLIAEGGGVAEGTRFADFIARSPRRHSTSLPLDVALAADALIAFARNGEPLEPIHGGPVRMIVPGRYFYKSVKWIERIDFLAEDRLGYWEAEAGYHNGADPALEERYIAANLDRRTVMALVAARDFSGRDLLSLVAEGMELANLKAEGALLRNADFRRAILTGADFTRANLSNARLAGADLSGAVFTDGDVEGADFSAANLDGADFSGASLFGATFFAEAGPARVTRATRFTALQLEALTPCEREAIIKAGATIISATSR